MHERLDMQELNNLNMEAGAGVYMHASDLHSMYILLRSSSNTLACVLLFETNMAPFMPFRVILVIE